MWTDDWLVVMIQTIMGNAGLKYIVTLLKRTLLSLVRRVPFEASGDEVPSFTASLS